MRRSVFLVSIQVISGFDLGYRMDPAPAALIGNLIKFFIKYYQKEKINAESKKRFGLGVNHNTANFYFILSKSHNISPLFLQTENKKSSENPLPNYAQIGDPEGRGLFVMPSYINILMLFELKHRKQVNNMITNKRHEQIKRKIRVAKALNPDWSYKQMAQVIDVTPNTFYNYLYGSFDLGEKKASELQSFLDDLLQ